jgi:hypothetical protein
MRDEPMVSSRVSELNRPSWTAIAAIVISVYGALLRLDAFTGKYGTLDHPAWARVATHQIAPLARHLRPSGVQWGRVPHPYVGGDPDSYLQFAREMTSFYQPHVREPVFLTTTRLALKAVDNQDAGVSLASAAGSVVTIFATYLLGAAVLSPVGGLVAAALCAIEYDSITWAVDGWRDDTFTAFFALTAWALVRFRERASFGRALLVGLLGGAACLTRLTALSFILPALVWIAFERRAEGRPRVEYSLVAAGVLTLLVLPYLINCAIAFGDPLLAVNHHTSYYRHAEGVAELRPMSAAEYLRGRLARRPLATIDVAGVGLFVSPFVNKWHQFDIWFRGLASVLRWSAAAGLILWLFHPVGRFMLLILIAALVPFAFTWNLGGGGEWRFTMHVYPIYIVAAIGAVVTSIRAVAHRPAWRTVRWRIAAVAVLVPLAVACYFVMPWFVKREAIDAAEDVNFETGTRDNVFFRTGWSPPHADGAVTSRVSQAERVAVHFPLPAKRAYQIVLRMDAVAPEPQRRVTILLNRQLIGHLLLSWNPERVGSYRLTLPAEWVRAGDNEIALIPDTMVTAGAAGPRFAWLAPDQRVGIRFWYLRVLDSPP